MRRLLKFLFLPILFASQCSFAQVVTTYIYTDPQNTPIAEANSMGDVADFSAYRAYGSLAQGSAVQGPGYTAHVMDVDIALIYMQQRYYDPVAARFISLDLLPPDGESGNHFNRYSYAENNPYSYTDPDGRCANLCTAAAGAAIGAIVGVAIEGFKQYRAGTFNGRSLAVEALKGAVVGGAIGLTGGAAATSGLTIEAQAGANYIVGSGFSIGAEAGGEALKGNPQPTADQLMVTGISSGFGAMAGGAFAQGTKEITTTVVSAVRAYPVTSLTGKTFYTLFVPAKVIERPVAAELLNDAASSAVEQTVKETIQ